MFRLLKPLFGKTHPEESAFDFSNVNLDGDDHLQGLHGVDVGDDDFDDVEFDNETSPGSVTPPVEAQAADLEVDAQPVENPFSNIAASALSALRRETPEKNMPQRDTSERGVAFEDVPLRDFIKSDPAMQALHPFLKKKPLPKEASGYTLFRTIFEQQKAKLEEMEGDYVTRRLLRGEEADDRIESLEGRYVRYIEQSRVFISNEDQVPGFKRVVLMGPAFVAAARGPYGQANQNEIGYIAINKGGGLSHGVIKSESKDDEPLNSVAEALEVLCNGRDGWTVKSDNKREFNFDLNRHSHGSRAMSSAGLSSIVRNLDGILTRKNKFKVKHILSGKAEKKMNLARWAICQSLDPEVLRTMRGTGQTMTYNAAWLTGARQLEHDPQKGQFRLQAVRAYPILAGQMLNNNELGRVIDEGQPLAPAIADYLNADESTVKRLQGLTWQRAATRGRLRLSAE